MGSRAVWRRAGRTTDTMPAADLSSGKARRIVLAAQGFNRRRPRARVGTPDLRRTIRQLGVLEAHFGRGVLAVAERSFRPGSGIASSRAWISRPTGRSTACARGRPTSSLACGRAPWPKPWPAS